jgi:hypothetical protein
VSDIDTAAVDSLKVLDPNRPIREATKYCRAAVGRYVREADIPSLNSDDVFQFPSLVEKRR